jgi:hypothetical protein
MRCKQYLGKCFWLLVAVLTLSFSPSLLHSQGGGNASVLGGELTWTTTIHNLPCVTSDVEYEYSSFTFQVGGTVYDLSGTSVDIVNAQDNFMCAPTDDSMVGLVVPSSLGYPTNCAILFSGQGENGETVSTVNCGNGFQALDPKSLLGDSLQLNNPDPVTPNSLSSPLPDSTTAGLLDSPVYFKTDDENNLYQKFRLVPVNHY